MATTISTWVLAGGDDTSVLTGIKVSLSDLGLTETDTLTATTDDDWITIDDVSYDALTITVEENDEGDSESDDEDDSESDETIISSTRTGTISITGSASATVKIYQWGKIIISSSMSDEYEFSSSADYIEVYSSMFSSALVDSSNAPAVYSVTISDDGEGWCSWSFDDSRISVSANTGSSRSCVVYLHLALGLLYSAEVSVIITQEHADGGISISNNALTIEDADASGTKTFTVTTSGGEVVSSVSSSDDWITVQYTSNTVTISYTSNTYGSARTATVTVNGSYGNKCYIYIKQAAGAYYLYASDTSLLFYSGAGTKSISFSAGSSVSVPLTATVGDSWVSVPSISYYSATIAVSPNTTDSARATTIVFSSSDEAVSVTITVWQAAVATMSNLKLIPFQCGDDESYVLLFHDNSTGDGVVVDIYGVDSGSDGILSSLDSPFPAGKEREIRHVQSFDVIFFAQGETRPCKLIREDDDGEYVFSFEEVEFTVEPLLDWDVFSTHTISVFALPDADLLTDGYYPKGVVRSSDGVFYQTLKDTPSTVSLTNENYYTTKISSGSQLAMTIDGTNDSESLVVGQTIAIKYTNTLYESQLWDYDTYTAAVHESYPEAEVLSPLESKTDGAGEELRPSTGGGYGNTSAWMVIRGEITLKTEGVWSGVIELQELDEDGNVFTIGKITSENGQSNTELTREVTEFGHAVRVVCTRREHAYTTTIYVTSSDYKEYISDADEGCQWTLSSTDIPVAYLTVSEKKTLSSGDNAYIVNCVGGLTGEVSSTSYALGAWSTQNGYPEQITIFQERMVYGCNKQKPTTLWLSKTNDWEDFEAGSDDTSAMNYTMQTDKYDRIRWLLALKSGITLGTDYGEWQFGEANGGVVTVDNARYINTSSIGSTTNIPAVVLGQALIMCKTGAEQLHRIDYNTLSEESAGTQLSLLSSHLFEDDPIYDMMVLRSPTNTMYCLHESGKLTSFTYEPEYDVAGWAQHSILDGVLAACVVRRSGVDIIAMIVKNGDEYVLGELNPQSEVYQDDGEDYTSTLIPTPLVSSQGGSAYGVKSVFAGVDVYATEGTQFEVCLPGGSWHHVEVGYDTSNTLVPFDKPKVTIPAAAGWEDEPLIAIRSSYAAPLTIAAIGAAIRRGK